MSIEISDIIQTVGSVASLVLIPIWRSINCLRDSQNKTNVILARDYVTKKECQHKHNLLHTDIVRIHGRIDEKTPRR
ncbi:hypothetical protein Dacet_2246 [Denitrovibrio acetiphilus DSM 12809]|uniref:Uncharacterized protein n=1 Tax=Denitrovibrio acetiphilus (strain DSM 12809 / NBRC 114555 / N2460) TaxID=522772 RepID=D4H2Y5_DENA2|nr:hypothetical protein [Denitrovibrio acetiphilus]ADD69008.1 hypothetical protein Dacet_2246 [Denitrovibrio acetiphilus DSM 12809]